MRKLSRLILVVAAFALPTSCKKKDQPEENTVTAKPPGPAFAPAAPGPKVPQGLFDPPTSAENPSTNEKIALGKQLFFDKRLSKDGSASCESCHFHDKGWAD